MNTGCVSQNLAPSVFSPSMYLQAHHRLLPKQFPDATASGSPSAVKFQACGAGRWYQGPGSTSDRACMGSCSPPCEMTLSISGGGPPAKRQPALIPACVGAPGKVVQLHTGQQSGVVSLRTQATAICPEEWAV